jgi:redox-sensitive bicupin YhaK (pirin superfamily)
MGNGETVHAGEVQRMTAGTGVLHSEFSSETDETHLLQIWILPDQVRLAPRYEQKKFPAEDKRGKLRLIASHGGDDGSITINQDVKLFASIMNSGEEVSYELARDRHAWLQLISGALNVNGEKLDAGDGAAISDETLLNLHASADNTEFLLFDLK